ncbi:MAG: CoA transferase [Burkholderiales bacterium]|nr:CoA transferase [Burkholderiales bacterium]
MSALPFGGMVVLDLTQIYNGPYATFLMARAGATVIKIEPPGGEHLRKRVSGERQAVTVPFAMLNANKQSVCLDLKTEAGRKVFLSLVEKADVVVENFTPSAMERLGLGADTLRALNPRLVYAGSSGYGSSGPYRDYPAMDLAVQAMAGVIGSTGFADGPPVKAGPAICDFMAGIHLFGAIATALLHRERTGEGATVEVSMMEAIYPALASNLGTHQAGDRSPKRTGNRHGGMGLAPYNVYPARDGYVAIITSNDKHWDALVQALALQHLAADPRFGTREARARHMDALDGAISAVTQEMAQAELLARLRAARAPCAPVQELDDVVNDPHLIARGSLRRIDHPAYGEIVVPESPLRFADLPAAPYRPSAPLGADTQDVLEQLLGLPRSEAATLAAALSGSSS